MNSPDLAQRSYRILATCALLHALLISLWPIVPFGDPWQTVGNVWVWFATSWLFWPIVLMMHRGRSLRRVLISLLVSVVILYPSFRDYPYVAPRAFGLPEGVNYLSIPAIRDYFSGYRAGRAQAEEDLRGGRLVHEEFGFPLPPEYKEILWQRYQIEVRVTAGDTDATETTVGHAKGYNDVSERQIKNRFGEGVLEAAAKESLKHWNEKSTH